MQRRLRAADIDFGSIRTDLGLSEEFGAAAQHEAETAVDRFADSRIDRTDLALVTIDPPGSVDLDQAVHIARDGDGFVVHYAIADVAALVVPQGALDQETRRRGQTIYFPDGNVPLHPRALSENTGSLLPEQVRPAVLWRIVVDAEATPVSVDLARAQVKSVARLDYAGVMADHAAGTLHASIAALPDFGELRQRLSISRGAIELGLPEQDVVRDADGNWELSVQPRTRADMWNSQVSLLTGMCAGALMLDHAVGLLRTLPDAQDGEVAALRTAAAALGVPWPESVSPGAFLARLDPRAPTTLALMSDATTLLRGSDYLALLGEIPADAVTTHGGIAGVYAHVTAPLRRLADRFATEVCLALHAGEPVPEWVLAALPTLPEIMRSSGAVAGRADRAGLDLAEAILLADRVGETFSATVLHPKRGKRPARIFIAEPPVFATCIGDPAEGSQISVRLTSADTHGPTLVFTAETSP
ncbi:MAG: ribonuclease II [Gordonia sp.]|nr:ribonuclease II [Gordonia sp. (in: high G+C Gram-positive bacteria)]